MSATGDVTLNTRQLVVLADGLIAGSSSTLVRSLGWRKQRPFVNPAQIGTVTAMAALPAVLAAGNCNGVSVDVEGAQVAGLMVGDTELCSDYLCNTAALWTLNAGWSDGGGKWAAAAGTNTAVEFTANILTDTVPYLVIMQVEDFVGGQVQARCGTGGLGAARTANGIYGSIITTTTTLKVGALGTGFQGSVSYLRPLRLGRKMAAFLDYPDEYSMIAAFVSGLTSAGVGGSVLYY